jgi:hypothetical protein
MAAAADRVSVFRSRAFVEPRTQTRFDRVCVVVGEAPSEVLAHERLAGHEVSVAPHLKERLSQLVPVRTSYFTRPWRSALATASDFECTSSFS